MELGMAVVGLAGILAYKSSVKRHGQIVEAPAVIDKVGNDRKRLYHHRFSSLPNVPGPEQKSPVAW